MFEVVMLVFCLFKFWFDLLLPELQSRCNLLDVYSICVFSMFMYEYMGYVMNVNYRAFSFSLSRSPRFFTVFCFKDKEINKIRMGLITHFLRQNNTKRTQSKMLFDMIWFCFFVFCCCFFWRWREEMDFGEYSTD